MFEEKPVARVSPSRSSLSRGARLGSYEIESMLGSGGMGEVYRARDTRLDRTVAIKVLPADVAGDPARRRRFETEARAISQLSHPHICALYDVGEAPLDALTVHGQPPVLPLPESVPYLVMEYLVGETLADRLRRKALTLSDSLQYATQIADALDAAHRRGIVHGDLKPANIMLTREGARLVDFGLARISSSQFADSAVDSQLPSDTVTLEGVIRGTLPYLPPELLEGRRPDVRSDVFALGAVLYEMLTRRRAFAGNTESEVVKAILDSQPAPLDTANAAIPPPLVQLVTTCLAKDPDERWQSAGDVRRQLSWITGSGQAAGQARVIERSAFSSVGLWRVAAGLFLLASLALVYALMSRDEPPVPARVSFQVLPPARSSFADLTLQLSPDGRSLAYVAAAPDGQRRLWVHTLETGEARMLSAAGTPGLAPIVWSPDSRFLAFAADGKIRRMAADGGSVQTLSETGGGVNAWSADDILLFVNRGVVMRVSASGGTPTPLTALDATRLEISHYLPRLLPDGRHFLYSRRSLSEENSGIFVGSIDARPDEQDMTRLIANAGMAIYVPAAADAPTGYLLFNRGATLLAQRFDPGTLQLHGDAVPVAEDLDEVGNPSGAAFFSASSNGVLAYRQTEPVAGTPVWVSRTGTELSAVVDASLPRPEQLRISPDGTRLAMIVDREIWVYDLSGRPAMKLTSGLYADMPLWSRDGKEIIYASTHSPFRLSSIRAEVGSTPTPVSPLGHYHPHGWSPDGDLITVLNSYSPSGWDILTLPRKDGVPAPLVQSPSDDGMFGASVSPDGKWLAYTLNATGQHEVWVRPYDGSAPPVRVSAHGGVDPQWARDGRELYFVENFRRLMVVAVALGTVFDFTPPRLLFEAPYPMARGVLANQSYDVAADGRFMLIRPAPPPASPTPITVVLNWITGLPN